MKDLPGEMPADLTVAAVPAREDPRDVLVSRQGSGLAELTTGAVVGTSSPRRAALLQAARPDLNVVTLRGNVDTRLRRLEEGVVDATVLAAAGLNRLGLRPSGAVLLDAEVLLPAIGRGAG
jgi:hydroxymethylbilane synthase